MRREGDQRLVRPVAWVLMAGAVTIWTGLALEVADLQLIGVAVCVGGLGTLAVLGWRISRDGSR